MPPPHKPIEFEPFVVNTLTPSLVLANIIHIQDPEAMEKALCGRHKESVYDNDPIFESLVKEADCHKCLEAYADEIEYND